ncbi:hypothetical protein [Bartonella raoultii]|uniref:hypothetical protein n=1 Tax=Bartonella raoultii TaxID=1457020 RepID=UPI001ABA378E|nr:hypothetical protein [Bartonella raoultii]
MKGKNCELDKEPRSFPVEEVFLSWRDCKIIFCICVIFVVAKEILFIPILLEWEFIEWEESTVFSVFVFWEVVTVCIFAFMPIVLILYVIMGQLLKKKIQKLEEVTKK